MKNLINKLQGVTKINALALAKKSSNIFNIFTPTLTELSKVNEEIEVEKNLRKEQISVLNSEVDVLNGIQSDNANMINKIDSFLK